MLRILLDFIASPRAHLGSVANGGKMQNLLQSFHVEWPLLMAQTLNFCIVAYVLYRFAFRPLIAKVDDRQRKIADGLQYAEETKQQLAQIGATRDKTMEKALVDADVILQKAKEKGDHFLQKAKEKAAIEVERMKNDGRAQLETERKLFYDEAMREISAEAAKLAEQCLKKHPGDCAKFTANAMEEIVAPR